MSTNKCSKGPWKVQPYVGTMPIEIKDPCGRLIACVSMGTYFEAKPNAQLIETAANSCMSVNSDNPQAAAEGIKGVYEALQGLVNEMSTEHDGFEEFKAAIIPLWAKAEEALTAAGAARKEGQNGTKL